MIYSISTREGLHTHTHTQTYMTHLYSSTVFSWLLTWLLPIPARDMGEYSVFRPKYRTRTAHRETI